MTTVVAALLVLVTALFLDASEAVEVSPFRFEVDFKGLSVEQFKNPTLQRQWCRTYTDLIGIDVRVRATLLAV